MRATPRPDSDLGGCLRISSRVLHSATHRTAVFRPAQEGREGLDVEGDEPSVGVLRDCGQIVRQAGKPLRGEPEGGRSSPNRRRPCLLVSADRKGAASSRCGGPDADPGVLVPSR